MLLLAYISLSLLVILPVRGTVFTDPSQLASTTYDFVIVGGQ